MHAFQIKKPLGFHGETFLPGDETRLMNHPKFKLDDIRNIIPYTSPLNPNKKWYDGPSKDVLHAAHLLTECDVRRARKEGQLEQVKGMNPEAVQKVAQTLGLPINTKSEKE